MRLLPIASVMLLSGCISFMPAVNRDVGTDPQYILENGVSAFRQFLIPVAHVDEGRRRVVSGEFDVYKFWGADDVNDRVVCTNDAGTTASPMDGRVFMSVELRVGSTTRRGIYASRTTISLLARGRRASHENNKIKCQLEESFAQRILAAVEAVAPGGNFILSTPAR